jgi:hypothetical protein
MGAAMIAYYNARYGVNLGVEWHGRCIADLIYNAVCGHNNFTHPGFHRTAPPQLQVIALN